MEENKSKWEEFKEKARETGEKVKEGAKKVGTTFSEVCNENPGIVFTLFTSVGGILIGILSGASAINEKREKMCLIEDDLTGCEYKTKHPLTNTEILELSDRIVDGQTKGEALDNMGLLKKEKKRK